MAAAKKSAKGAAAAGKGAKGAPAKGSGSFKGGKGGVPATSSKKGGGGGSAPAAFEVATSTSLPEGYSPRLKDHYKNVVVPALMKEFGYKNPMQVPFIEKVVVNMGVGLAGQTGGDPKLLDYAIRDLTAITGQKPVVTTAKKSVANFRLRAGARIGAKVTLRKVTMYEFMDRLFNITLPRVRDFQGINPNSFDGRGNFSMGLKEQLTFPEIEYDKIDRIRGMDVIIVTSAKTDAEARFLLNQMGLPFRSTANTGTSGAVRMQ